MTIPSVANHPSDRPEGIGLSAPQKLQEEKRQEEKEADSLALKHSFRFDRLEKGEKNNPAGLYSIAGFSKNAESQKSEENRNQDTDNPPSEEEPKVTKCTINTDRVDSEIKKLHEQKEKIKQQLNAASDDPEKREKLQKELQNVDSQLLTKDNDSYRKQHSSVSFS